MQKNVLVPSSLHHWEPWEDTACTRLGASLHQPGAAACEAEGAVRWRASGQLWPKQGTPCKDRLASGLDRGVGNTQSLLSLGAKVKRSQRGLPYRAI